MKVIDLLNKIANDEELPTKIRIWGGVYYLCENDNSGQCYFTKKEGFGGFPLKFNTSQMNDEVEIIEENKKIEQLKFEHVTLKDFGDVEYVTEIILKKITEVVDEINKLKEGK